jgi:DNA-binding CsgD family transcriptional regulator
MLASDAGADVLVVDLRRTVAAATAPFLERCALSGHPAGVGAPMRAAFSEIVAAERAEHLCQALCSGHSIRCVGMIFGRFCDSVTRPLLDADGRCTGAIMVVPGSARTGEADGRHDAVLVRASTHDLGRLSAISARELCVLRQVCLGRSSREIGKREFRSSRTIDNQRASIVRKLDVRGIADLIQIGIEAGLHAMSDEDIQAVTGVR